MRRYRGHPCELAPRLKTGNRPIKGTGRTTSRTSRTSFWIPRIYDLEEDELRLDLEEEQLRLDLEKEELRRDLEEEELELDLETEELRLDLENDEL